MKVDPLTCLNLLWLFWLTLRYQEHDKRHEKHDESIRDVKEQFISFIVGRPTNNENNEDVILRYDTSVSNTVERVNTKAINQNSTQDERKLSLSIPTKTTTTTIRKEKNRINSYTDIKRSNISFLKKENTNYKEKQKSTNRNRNNNKRRMVKNTQTECKLISYSNSTFVRTLDSFVDQSESALSTLLTTSTKIEFYLSFTLNTDLYPWETSWDLSPREEGAENDDDNNNDKLIIDSMANESYIELSPETLYNFQYFCSASSSTTLNKDNTCYEFSIHDSWGDGNCCWFGIGYFSLQLNDDFLTTSDSERFYSYTHKTSFCLGDNDSMNESSEKSNAHLLYPSRECLNGMCICDSEPALLSNYNDIESKYPGLHELKRQTFTKIRFLSGTQTLFSPETPQYKAACWVLNDDPYLTHYNTSTTYTEKRIMQRYILAVIYFATKPQNWSMHLNFLSSQSECDWHDDFYHPQNQNSSVGTGCDKNDNIISLLFHHNNLDGSIVGEISGLESLESLVFYREPKIVGTLFSTIGYLTDLRYVVLGDLSIEGSIPPELFNATKIEELIIMQSKITHEIPSTINQLQGLQYLTLSSNQLNSTIPETIYSLTQLRMLDLSENQLSSTISSSIGNLKMLKDLNLHNNKLSSTLPSDLSSLSRLEYIDLGKNTFSGPIPTLASLSNLEKLNLVANFFTGNLNYICENKPVTISADCRNNIFQPTLTCSCCEYCADRTPTYSGACPDTNLKFILDHNHGYTDRDTSSTSPTSRYSSTEGIQWSITDTLSRKVIMSEGPYNPQVSTFEPFYETCIASTDRFSFNMMAEPQPLIDVESAPIDYNTNYSIYWNDKLVLEDTFVMNVSDKTVIDEVTFQYNALTEEIQIDTSPTEMEIICNGKPQLITQPSHRLYVNRATAISGTSKLNDPISPQSRALCWIINEETEYYQSTEYTALIRQFTQRYVLTLLHLTSKSRLFGNNDLPPSSHECRWNGVQCARGKNTVTSLSLPGQIIGGTLVEEISSMSFLEILNLKDAHLKGTIPDTFSNLYSLKEINLSRNRLVGSIPKNFFTQLDKLELLDLSDNVLTGIIPDNIGAHCEIHTLLLNKNRLIGTIPLDKFRKFMLKHLDLSENGFRGTISPDLLRHTNIETINFGNNGLSGALMENLFDELKNLVYFNVSQNIINGEIPSLLSHKPKIEQLDLHFNQLSGIIPVNLEQMRALEYLNLQGNRLVGSIPMELNNLEHLHTLALSHNKLIGSIPLQLNDQLSNLKRLYLHSNKLRGEAPLTEKTMTEYITDCGEEFLTCHDCSICCNDEKACINNIRIQMLPSVYIFITIFVVVLLCYSNKKKIMRTDLLKKQFHEKVSLWKASDLIGTDKTVYHYFLTQNKVGWIIGLATCACQVATLSLFLVAADASNNNGDVQYTIQCPEYSLECEDNDTRTIFGYTILGLVIVAWLLRDIIGSFKLFLLSMHKKNIDFFFASIIVMFVSLFSVATSIYYNYAIASNDTEMIYDAVILLFVNEIDERLYQLAESCNLSWVYEVNESVERQSYHDKKDLIIYRSIHRMRKRIRSFHHHYLSGRSMKMKEPEIAVECADNIVVVDDDDMTLTQSNIQTNNNKMMGDHKDSLNTSNNTEKDIELMHDPTMNVSKDSIGSVCNNNIEKSTSEKKKVSFCNH